MDISVTDFKQRCLEIIRQVERTGGPAPTSTSADLPIWEQLRAAGGRLHASPAESAITDEDFEALR
jgi:hypothetical protein